VASPLFDKDIRQHRVNEELVWIPVTRGKYKTSAPIAPDEAGPRDSVDSTEDPGSLEAVMTVEEMERAISESSADAAEHM